jgi:hypothetical protein
MRKPNEINSGRWVRISEKTFLDLEGRCSIHLSYGRRHRDISGRAASAQARLSRAFTAAGAKRFNFSPGVLSASALAKVLLLLALMQSRVPDQRCMVSPPACPI